MSGIIGKKVGMTSFYDDNGKNIPCTVIEAGPCVITQLKTTERMVICSAPLLKIKRNQSQ